MHTLSGRRFDLGGSFVPSVQDIAVGLSRIPRWAGATIRDWSVLQHVLSAHAVGIREGEGPVVQLALLMHDMEEMATGDIPSPFKTNAQRALGDELRKWMWRGTLGLNPPEADVEDKVSDIDARCAIAEAHTLCHPLVRMDEEFRGGWDLNSVDAVWNLMNTTPERAIDLFIGAVDTLLATKEIKALTRRA